MQTDRCARSCLLALSTLASFLASPVAAQVFAPPVALNANAATDGGADRRPRLASDGAGHWVAVWHSNDPLGGTVGTDNDVFFARSADDGETWTAPAPLNSNAPGDTRHDETPDIATDGAGTWVVVWESNDTLGETIGTDTDVLAAYSTDEGASWSTAQPVNAAATDSGDDVAPRIATDAAGAWVVVWETTDSLGASLGNDRDIATARSLDGGVSWSPAAPLNTTAAGDAKGDFTPAVAADGAGAWVAVWRSQESLGGQIGNDDDVLLARSLDGLVWSPPALLNTNAVDDSGDDFEPVVASDAPGSWIAAWRSQHDLGNIGTDDDILVTRSTDGGIVWTAPAPLNLNAAFDSRGDYEPSLASEAPGTWLAVWRSRDALDGTGGPTIGTDDDVVVARSTNGGLTWSMPRPLADEAIADSSEDAFPAIATNGAGLLLAVWESRNPLGNTIGTDADILVVRGSICGDGAVGPGEACDDGNQVGTDCCTNTCQLGPGSICDDGDPCTVGDGCFGGTCAGAPMACAMCETCIAAAGGCVAAPRTGCVQSADPARGQLQLKNKTKNSGDRLLFKLFKGGAVSPAELGSPTTSSDHALCLWDESGAEPTLVFRATAPAGGSCRGLDCWQHPGPISLYKDPERTPDGIKGVVVRAGDAGRSQVSVKGKGEALAERPLGMPSLPLALPVRAQYQIRDGACWETRYTDAGVKRNDESRFKAQGSE